jgi:hypothetical protein
LSSEKLSAISGHFQQRLETVQKLLQCEFLLKADGFGYSFNTRCRGGSLQKTAAMPWRMRGGTIRLEQKGSVQRQDWADFPMGAESAK